MFAYVYIAMYAWYILHPYVHRCFLYRLICKICVCMHACMYVYVYMCICVYACMYVCICVYVCMHVRMCVYAYVYVYICMHVCMYMCMYFVCMYVRDASIIVTYGMTCYKIP